MAINAAFIVTARNKAKYAYKAAASALAQTYPCEILLSDQHSDDETLSELMRAADSAPRAAAHKVKVVKCPVEGPYSMKACNEHIMWCVSQVKADWVFQCSADDYSLPDRVRVCMKALEDVHFFAAGVATTMFFEPPAGLPVNTPRAASGFPTKTGYVDAGEGIWKMAYGSTIWGYQKKFLEKVGSAGDSTADVYYGFLAALDQGYYVVCNPQHVHVQHASTENMGFQGKMAGAVEGSDEHFRLNELNRYQLLELYYSTALRAQELYPKADSKHMSALANMIMAQSKGWLDARKELHKRKITPGIID